MKTKIHAIAGALATLTIFIFLASTLISELFGSYELVAAVKKAIVMPGLFILIPCIIATGGSGFNLSQSRGGRIVQTKMKRMPFIGANGVLVLIPCALILNHWAANGQFDTTFYLVQALEILAGITNLTLLSLNMRDGLKLTGKLSPKRAAKTA